MLVYILIAMNFFLILTLIWSMNRQPKMNQQLLNQNRELLNRLQAPDARTFQALQTFSTVSTPEYIPSDPESEAVREKKPVQDFLTVDEVNQRDVLGDFGIKIGGDPY